MTRAGGWGDALRLAVGTLTIAPVPPPSVVDRRVAGRAMAVAPVVGVGGALALGCVLAVGTVAGAPSPVVALAALAVLAGTSRLLHLDGVADLADGLTVPGDPGRALEVMRRGDVGPAGAVALVLTLGTQACSLASLLELARTTGSALPLTAAAVAVPLSRLALPWACALPLRPARPGGLGSTVTRTVGAAPALAVTALTVGAAVALIGPVPASAATAGAAVGAGWALLRGARRLGGLTGDVLGAAVECAVTGALVALATVGV